MNREDHPKGIYNPFILKKMRPKYQLHCSVVIFIEIEGIR